MESKLNLIGCREEGAAVEIQGGAERDTSDLVQQLSSYIEEHGNEDTLRSMLEAVIETIPNKLLRGLTREQCDTVSNMVVTLLALPAKFEKIEKALMQVEAALVAQSPAAQKAIHEFITIDPTTHTLSTTLKWGDFQKTKLKLANHRISYAVKSLHNDVRCKFGNIKSQLDVDTMQKLKVALQALSEATTDAGLSSVFTLLPNGVDMKKKFAEQLKARIVVVATSASSTTTTTTDEQGDVPDIAAHASAVAAAPYSYAQAVIEGLQKVEVMTGRNHLVEIILNEQEFRDQINASFGRMDDVVNAMFEQDPARVALTIINKFYNVLPPPLKEPFTLYKVAVNSFIGKAVLSTAMIGFKHTIVGWKMQVQDLVDRDIQPKAADLTQFVSNILLVMCSLLFLVECFETDGDIQCLSDEDIVEHETGVEVVWDGVRNSWKVVSNFFSGKHSEKSL